MSRQLNRPQVKRCSLGLPLHSSWYVFEVLGVLVHVIFLLALFFGPFLYVAGFQNEWALGAMHADSTPTPLRLVDLLSPSGPAKLFESSVKVHWLAQVPTLRPS